MNELLGQSPNKKRADKFNLMKMKRNDAIGKMSDFAKIDYPQINVSDVRAFSEEQIIDVKKRKLKLMADRRNNARKKVLQLGL